MRSITLICALGATLLLLPSNALAAGGWTWPVRGPVLTPYRNGGDPYAAGQHRGIDIGAPAGSRVVAAAGGTVTFAGVVGSSGLTVSERTADGRFDLSYLHLSSVAVHRGDLVAAGAALGAVGTSGRRSVEAPHLHFGVREAGERDAYRDPLDFLAPPPAGEAPQPAPAPVPVAHPVAAAPAASAAPAPTGAPGVSAPAGSAAPGALTLPGGASSPVPAASAPLSAAPLAAGGPAAARRATGRPLVAHHGALPSLLARRGPSIAAQAARPSADPAHGTHGLPGAARTAWSGPAGAGHPGIHTQAAPSATPHGRGSNSGHGGIDLGWLIACLGLVAAATALGRPDAARKLAARGRARFGAMLRPASRGS
jgi:hypothetical protein